MAWTVDDRVMRSTMMPDRRRLQGSAVAARSGFRCNEPRAVGVAQLWHSRIGHGAGAGGEMLDRRSCSNRGVGAARSDAPERSIHPSFSVSLPEPSDPLPPDAPSGADVPAQTVFIEQRRCDRRPILRADGSGVLGSTSMASEPLPLREDADYEQDLGQVSLLVFGAMSVLGALVGFIVGDLLRSSPVDSGTLARLGAYSVQVWWLWQVLPRADGSRALLGAVPAWRSWLMGVGVVLSLWCLLAGASWAVALLGEGLTPAKQQAVDRSVAALVLAVLITGLATPVLEEVVFRGVLFRRWRRPLGPTRAAWASSVVFTLLHPPQQLVGTLLYALLAVLLYTSTRTLWVPIGVHIANNTAAVYVGWQKSRDASIDPGQALDATMWWAPVLLLVPSCVWLSGFVRKSWRTLGAPLPPYERAEPRVNSQAHV